MPHPLEGALPSSLPQYSKLDLEGRIKVWTDGMKAKMVEVACVHAFYPNTCAGAAGQSRWRVGRRISTAAKPSPRAQGARRGAVCIIKVGRPEEDSVGGEGWGGIGDRERAVLCHPMTTEGHGWTFPTFSRLYDELIRVAGQDGVGAAGGGSAAVGDAAEPGSGSVSSVETEDLLRRNLALMGGLGGGEEEEEEDSESMGESQSGYHIPLAYA